MFVDLLRLCRPYYCVPLSLTYLLTVYYARGGRMDGQWGPAALSAGALALLIAFGHVMNDLRDVAVDRINHPRRPLAAGRVTRPVAMALCAGLLIAAGGLAAGASVRFAAGLACVAVALGVYNLVSKRLGAAKPVYVAALAVSIYPLAIAQAGGAVGPRAGSLAAFAPWFFLTALGYEILKDLRDAEGDREAAKRPSAIQERPKLWRRMAAGVGWLGAALLVGPVFLGCGWVYMVIAAGAMAAAVVGGMLRPRRALAAVYIECLLVGAAATLDVVILGI